MALFVISDLHLSLGTNKAMDCFTGWENYVAKLNEYWQDRVAPDDTVVLPGDFSWSMTLQEAFPDFTFVEKLNGTKILLKGNHDYWWNSIQKINNFWEENGLHSFRLIQNTAFMYGSTALCGTRGWFFENMENYSEKIAAREVLRLEFSLKDAIKQNAEKIIVFLHFPPVFGSNACDDLIDLMRGYGVRNCYYGHLHGNSAKAAFIGEYKGINLMPTSADRLHFTPLEITL